MLFNSFEFILIFLPVVFLLYFFLNKIGWTFVSKIWLVLASLFFYSWWNIIYLPLLLTSMILNFSIGKKLITSSNKLISKIILTLGIIFNVGLLSYFKYSDFFIINFNRIFDSNLNTFNLLLPLAISFFTFQQIAYIVDAYRHETKNYSFLDYSIFITFFPQLIAGPIVYHADMLPQFEGNKNKLINYKNITIGIFLFSLGLFKKVIIADSFAEFANIGYSNISTLTFSEAWITSLAYTFQLYFDFSGYSDMAIGIALLFNIKLPINFNSPYKALNIQDFWRRWHITLNQFLTKYIFIPLGGSRKGNFRTYTNIMIIFVISGVWHGAGWTFIIWGALHGIATCIHRLWKNTNINLPKFIAWFITFNFVNVAWIFFKSTSYSDAITIIKKMFSFEIDTFYHINIFNFIIDKYISLLPIMININYSDYLYFFIILLIFIITLLLCVSGKNSIEISYSFKPNVMNSLIIAILFSLVIFNMQRVSEFLYFNF